MKGFKNGLFGEYERYLSFVEKDALVIRFSEMVKSDILMDVERKDKAFWSEVLKNPNIKQIGETSIYFETITEGTGGFPTEDSDIEARYIFTNNVGDTLGGSYERETLKINLTHLIAGWREAFPSLQKGGTYRLYIPWEKPTKMGIPIHLKEHSASLSNSSILVPKVALLNQFHPSSQRPKNNPKAPNLHIFQSFISLLRV